MLCVNVSVSSVRLNDFESPSPLWVSGAQQHATGGLGNTERMNASSNTKLGEGKEYHMVKLLRLYKTNKQTDECLLQNNFGRRGKDLV